MIRRTFRFGLLLGLLGGIAFVVAKVVERWQEPTALPQRVSTGPWPRLTDDEPETAPVAPWVEPKGGVCPTSHPVKAKLTSKIFHLPGMTNYERTNPDRCYVDGQQAEADGLRAAKR